jgi:hypothetical protein
MGVFYGIAKRFENQGIPWEAKWFRILSVLVPACLHGAYDYIASTQSSTWYFIVFIAVLFLVSFGLVMRTSRRDRFIG